MGKTRENLKKNIGYYLELNKISQKELAERLGVSQSAVTNWIKGKNSPDIELVAEMCRIFDISIMEMMGVSEHSKSETDLVKEKLIRNYEQLNSKGREELLSFSNYQLTVNSKKTEKEPVVIAAHGQSKENEEFLKEVGKKIGEIF